MAQRRAAADPAFGARPARKADVLRAALMELRRLDDGPPSPDERPPVRTN
jgi:hypothetical protein